MEDDSVKLHDVCRDNDYLQKIELELLKKEITKIWMLNYRFSLSPT